VYGVVACAVWFSGPRHVETRDERLPDVGERDIRVRTVASVISHGTEVLVYRAEVDPGLALDLPAW